MQPRENSGDFGETCRQAVGKLSHKKSKGVERQVLKCYGNLIRRRSAVLLLLLLPILTCVQKISTVEAWTTSEIVYIRADGSVDPPAAPIQRNGDLYTFTENINVELDGIRIERDNMTLDGTGYTLYWSGPKQWIVGTAIYFDGRSNITIKNMRIIGFRSGVVLSSSSNITISSNYIYANGYGAGIQINSSHQISVTENYVGYTVYGVGLLVISSSNNAISGNTFKDNHSSLVLSNSSNNSIHHNNFMDSVLPVSNNPDFNFWDNGYPSGGNYWSSHPREDRFSGAYQNESGSDGICDTPFRLSFGSQDRYPLLFPFNSPPTPPVAEFSVQSQSMPMHVQDSVAFNVTFWLPGWNGTHVSPLLEYRWDFGDGNVTSTVATLVVHAYTYPQTCNVTLTAVGSGGLNSSSFQVLDIWMPTSLSISTGASSAFVGYTVDISGKLQDLYGNSVKDQSVVLYYTFPAANTWVPVTSDTTDLDGKYQIKWIPPATGYFTLKAEWSGNSTFLGADDVISLGSIPYQDMFVFSVESNSSISALTFNSTSSELSFNVSGETGTKGYVKVIIAKSLVSDVAKIKVHLDSTLKEYTATPLGGSWLLYVSYEHSLHKVTVGLGAIPPATGGTPGIDALTAALLVAVLGIGLLTAVILVRRRKRSAHQDMASMHCLGSTASNKVADPLQTRLQSANIGSFVLASVSAMWISSTRVPGNILYVYSNSKP